MSLSDATEAHLRSLIAPLATHRTAIADAAQRVDGTFGKLADAVGALMSDDVAIEGHARDLETFVQEKTALVSAYRLFERSAGLVEVNIASTRDIQQEVSEVLARMGSTRGLRGDFSQSVRMFWILGMTIRVEVARLPPSEREGILQLVAGMEDIYHGLRRLVDVQFRGIDDICVMLADIHVHVANVRAGNRVQVDEAWKEIRALLASLEDALSGVSGFCDQIAAQNASMKGSFSAILVALQYQDIVRQRLEHVALACGQAFEPEMDEEPERRWAVVHHVATVQQAQVAEALRELAKAEDVILCHSGQLLESSLRALQATRDLQSKIVRALENTNAARAFVHTIARLHHTIASTRGIAGEVNGAVEQVRARVLTHGAAMTRFTYDLRLIALNAQVHAARVSAGGPLEVLSAETRRSSDETRGNAEHLLAQVRDTVPLLEQVTTTLTDLLSASSRDEVSLRSEGAEVERALEQMVVTTATSFVDTEASFEEVRRKVQNSVSGLTFGGAVTRALEAARHDFERLASETSEVARLFVGDQKLAARLEELRLGYVMQDQRAVHDAATGNSASDDVLFDAEATSPVPAPSGEESDADLGDNVELF
jgi:hypothetical protein